jgi:MFS superfamily sulfate permease-like transporter
VTGTLVGDRHTGRWSHFGARTGGTDLIEGLIEVSLGLFFAGSIAALFAAFPMAIVGAMMFLVGIELVKFARDLRWNRELLPVAATVLGSVALNMAVGFGVGLAAHYLLCRRAGGAPDGK